MPIEVVSPDLASVVSPDAPVTELSSGYGGADGPAEGPLWWHEGGYLLFSDIHNNRRMKWTAGDGVSLFSEPTNRANGLTRDPSGRLLACEHLTRRVTRQEAGGWCVRPRARRWWGPGGWAWRRGQVLSADPLASWRAPASPDPVASMGQVMPR